MRDPPGFVSSSEVDNRHRENVNICPSEVGRVPRQLRVRPPDDDPAPLGREPADDFAQRLATALLRALATWPI